jgi:hypothetical protein
VRGVSALALVLVAAAAMLVACGGSDRMSAGAYRGKLAAISRETSAAVEAVQKNAPRAKSVKDLQAVLTQFANAESHIANQVQALRPPKNAQAANEELAVGATDTSKSAVRAANAIGKLSSVQAARSYLGSHNGNKKGAHELDDALAKLKSLGYTKGS